MVRKRVLIFTNHFYPETFKINDVAFHLNNEGLDITVITGIPNYPKGKFFPGYGFFNRRKEEINGVRVIRLPLIPRGRGSGVRLVINYISFAISIVLYSLSLFFRRKEKYDIILVHHTSPVFVGIGGVIAKKMQGAKLLFWDLDLWPESIIAASNIKNRLVINSINKLVRWIYKNSDTIFIGSRSFSKPITEKGVNKKKIIYFPNWAEDIFTKEAFVKLDNSDFANSFNIMFAGNIGEAQDFDSIIECAKLTQKYNIKWLIVGNGRKLHWVKEQIERFTLKNIILMGHYPIDNMPGIFKYANVMLVSLKDREIFKLTVPAKIQAYMASKKPIIAMLNGEGAQIIKEANCGKVCNAEDFLEMSKKILELYSLSNEELIQLGLNGFDYYKKHFEKEKVLNNLLEVIQA
ncbi:MAG: glycosyltransferase family 4 protein [Filimonas sp.]|nr:glycosyltransferase family 4 protein [Filimonas sp.]